jgi:NAD(P)-dependent dehydrogenase (short-subunit alcohol dehydrogenase family)
MNPFEDKVAIVTGGASGIGRGLCEELARRGAAMVMVADVNAERAQETAINITRAGGKARVARVDVAKEEDVRALVDGTAEAHGRLDYIFNNAGITVGGDMRDMTLEHWRRSLDVNLGGVIYGTMAAYRVMVAQGSGHIVNTSSAGGLTPVPMGTSYAVAKHGIVGLSTSLRAEAAALGVKVSVVCPGFIRTNVAELTVYVTPIKEGASLDSLAPSNPMEPDVCARIILRGVARNKGIIPVTTPVWIMWWLYRISPELVIRLFRGIASRYRALARRNS